MFRTVPLSIIRSFPLYTQQWNMSYRFAYSLRAGSGRKILPDQQTSPLPSPPYVLRAPPILFSSIVSPELYLESSTDQEVPQYVAFSIPCYLVPQGSNILLSTLFPNTLILRSSISVSDIVSHPYKTTGKIIVLYILVLILLDRKYEDKRVCTEWWQALIQFNLFFNFITNANFISLYQLLFFKSVKETNLHTFFLEAVVTRHTEAPVIAGDTHSVILHREGHDTDACIT